MMNKITYSINWMGPINTKWIQEHGDCWACGRIDVYGTESMWGDEIGVPPMLVDDWKRFGDWLEQFETDIKWTLDELVYEYEKTNPRIVWEK